MNTEVNYRINKLCRNSISKKIEAIRWQKSGKITNVVGTLIEASLDGSQIGTICEIELKKNTSYVKAEVVGFRGNKALLLPYENLKGVFLGSKIKILKISDTIPVGESLLGHVFDSFLQPLSTTDHSIFNNCKPFNLENEPPNPMSRNRIVSPMNLGVKAIDGLLTFCEGQRMGSCERQEVLRS